MTVARLSDKIQSHLGTMHLDEGWILLLALVSALYVLSFPRYDLPHYGGLGRTHFFFPSIALNDRTRLPNGSTDSKYLVYVDRLFLYLLQFVSGLAPAL